MLFEKEHICVIKNALAGPTLHNGEGKGGRGCTTPTQLLLYYFKKDL